MSADLAALAMGCAGFTGIAAGMFLSALDPELLRACGSTILRISVGLAFLAAVALLAVLGQALAG